MIVVEKTLRIKARISEWILTLGLLVWGIVIGVSPHVFGTETYGPMSILFSHSEWTGLVFFVAIARLITLFIDKLWVSLPHLRAFGAIGSLILWGSLFSVSLTFFNARPTGIALYGMLMAFDLLAVWWAAGDAKIADRTK